MWGYHCGDDLVLGKDWKVCIKRVNIGLTNIEYCNATSCINIYLFMLKKNAI